jgi:hypothetical protein
MRLRSKFLCILLGLQAPGCSTTTGQISRESEMASSRMAVLASAYEQKENQILRAFLDEQLARPRISPPCISPTLAAPYPTSRAAFTRIQPTVETFDRDARILLGRPGQVATQPRTLSLSEVQRLFPGSRSATASECSSTFHFSRPFIYPRIAFLAAQVTGPCMFASWRASLQRVDQEWQTKFSDAYNTIGGLPGCGTRASSDPDTSRPYIMIVR